MRVAIHFLLGKFFLRMARFLRSLPVVVMKSDDLIRFSQETYLNPSFRNEWTGDTITDSGLQADEQNLYEQLPNQTGRMLVLGIGGGREAIFFGRRGFQVEGIDFIPEMVNCALENAKRRGIDIKAQVQEISQLRLPSNCYDVVWFTRPLYSCIPARKKRIHMLAALGDSLKTGGCIGCQFHWDPLARLNKKEIFIRRLIAILTLGNFSWQPGDMLWGGVEFSHAFSSKNEVLEEFNQAGFLVAYSDFYDHSPRGCAVLVKKT